MAGGEITLQQDLTADKAKLHDATASLFIERQAWRPLDTLFLAASELAAGDLVLLSTGTDDAGNPSTPEPKWAVGGGQNEFSSRRV